MTTAGSATGRAPAPPRVRLRAGTHGLPPGPRLPTVAQTVLWFFATERFSRWCRSRYGDMFTLQLPVNGTVVQVCEPAGVREVFAAPPDDARAGEANVILEPLVGTSSVLLLDGPEHLRQRRLLLPAFHGDRLQGFTSIMVTATMRELSRWQEGESLALREPMQRITLEVILRAVFGVDNGPQLAALVARLTDLLATNSQLAMLPGMRRDWGARSPWGHFLRARDAVDDAVLRLIAERRAAAERGEEGGRGDILHTLLAARDETGVAMSDRELRDELMTLLLAGHETTATALTWFFALTLRAPVVERRLRAEMERGETQDYLDACIRETLRVRPVVPIVARRLHAPLRVLGRTLPAGIAVAPSIIGTQRNGAVHDEPDAFRPERFLGTRPDPATWFPFGGGVRRCLGASFATLEMRSVITTVLRHSTLSAVGRRPEGSRRRAVTLVPRHGGRVRVDRLSAP